MNVHEVKAVAQEWVKDNYAGRPEFVGAHLMGGLNEMDDDAEFPSYSDVDMNVVLEGEGERWPIDVLHKGLMIECGRESADLYRPHETVISDPSLAPNLLEDSILLDPHGVLGEAQDFIRSEYRYRKWVQARCEKEKQDRIEPHIPTLKADEATIFEKTGVMWYLATYLSGLVCVASIKRPTHRKSLIKSHEILKEHQALHLHDALLELYGCADWNESQVRDCLEDAIVTFDRAVEIHKTPHLGDFKLKQHLRPYFYEAMIDDGFHREAMPWINLIYVIGALTIQLDGTDEERDRFLDSGVLAMFAALGLSSQADFKRRAEQAREVADDYYAFCDALVERYPEFE